MESSSGNVYSMESDLGSADLLTVFSELIRLETELWDAVEGRIRAQHGVALGSYEVMRVIAGQPGCRVQDIAGALSITVGGVSKIIDRIEAAGYCARRGNPADRRPSVIELPPAGGHLLGELTRTVEQELARRLGPALPGGSAGGGTRPPPPAPAPPPAPGPPAA